MERIDPIIAESRLDGAYAVTLIRRPRDYQVKYGAHLWSGRDLHAALEEFSDCVEHAAACAGLAQWDE